MRPNESFKLMNTRFLLFATSVVFAFTLSGCGSDPEPAPVAAPTEVAEVAPALPAPDQELFTELFAKTCPAAEAVSTAACKRAGLGSKNVICEFGLGEDDYLRHKATLEAGETEWTLAEPEALCAEHDSHHVPS